MNGWEIIVKIKIDNFVNVNFSITLAYSYFNFFQLILHTHSEGIVSNISHLVFYVMPKIEK